MICCEPLEGERKKLKAGPVCGHVFHAECIDRWVQQVQKTKRTTKFSCPTCKAQSKSHEAVCLFLSFGGEKQGGERPRVSNAEEVSRGAELAVLKLELQQFKERTHANETKRIELVKRCEQYEKERKDLLVKLRHSERNAADWRNKLLAKGKECRALRQRVEQFAVLHAANTGDVDELEKIAQEVHVTDRESAKLLVRSLRQTVLLQKNERTRLYKECDRLKREIQSTKAKGPSDSLAAQLARSKRRSSKKKKTSSLAAEPASAKRRSSEKQMTRTVVDLTENDPRPPPAPEMTSEKSTFLARFSRTAVKRNRPNPRDVVDRRVRKSSFVKRRPNATNMNRRPLSMASSSLNAKNNGRFIKRGYDGSGGLHRVFVTGKE